MMYSKIILFSLFFNIFNSFSLDQTQEINYLPIELQLIVNELKERNAILIEMLRQENILFFKEIEKYNDFQFFKEHPILIKNNPNIKELKTINKLLANYICKIDCEKYDEIKNEVFQKNKQYFKNAIILYGKPGNGKTTYIKKIAELSGSKLFEIKGSTIVHPQENKGSQSIDEIFKDAYEHSFSYSEVTIVFIDEIDSFANNIVNPYGSDKKATQTLWLNMDDCKNNFRPVFVAFSTNNLQDIHCNIRQRIDAEIEILNPNAQLRKKLINDFFKKFNINFEKNLKSEDIVKQLIRKTEKLTIRNIEKAITASVGKAKLENKGVMRLATLEQEINNQESKQNSFDAKERISKIKSLISEFIFYGSGLIGIIYSCIQMFEYIKSKRNNISITLPDKISTFKEMIV